MWILWLHLLGVGVAHRDLEELLHRVKSHHVHSMSLGVCDVGLQFCCMCKDDFVRCYSKRQDQLHLPLPQRSTCSIKNYQGCFNSWCLILLYMAILLSGFFLTSSFISYFTYLFFFYLFLFYSKGWNCSHTHLSKKKCT